MANLTSLNVKNAKVLVRVDFNVPLDSDKNVTDDTRIQAAIPTIQSLLNNGAAVILMSHLGRPQKKKKEDGSINVEKFSLKPAADHLAKVLDTAVAFATDTIGEDAKAKVNTLQPGQILVLENTRFEAGESKGDEKLAQALAEFGDFYINDAFGTAHRAHASTTVVAKHFAPENRAFGLLMEKEIANARSVLNNGKKPIVAVTGGAKVSDKVLLLEKLIDLADDIIVGGGMAYTFIKAQGGQVGKSLLEQDLLDKANEILVKAKTAGVGIHLPVDSRCAEEFSGSAASHLAQSNAIPTNQMGLDIGPDAQADFDKVIKGAKTILWNGPMGVFEFEAFSKGTLSVAKSIAEATRAGAFSLVGGGDSVAAVAKSGLKEEISFVSTGGGALLEFLEGKTLPGVAAIEG